MTYGIKTKGDFSVILLFLFPSLLGLPANSKGLTVGLRPFHLDLKALSAGSVGLIAGSKALSASFEALSAGSEAITAGSENLSSCL